MGCGILGLPARPGRSWSRWTTALRPRFLLRIRDKVEARIVWIGDEVVWPEGRRAPPVAPRRYRLARRAHRPRGARYPRRYRRNRLHLRSHGRSQGRHHHASQYPRQRRAGGNRDPEIPALRRPVLPSAIPESSAAEPHVRPGDGHVHPADAAGRGGVHAGTQPGRNHPADSWAADLGAGVRAENSRDPARVRRAAISRGGHGIARGRAMAAALVALPPHSSAVRLEVLGVRGGRRAARAGCGGVLVAPRVSDDSRLWADRNRADCHAESSVPRAPGHGRQRPSAAWK